MRSLLAAAIAVTAVVSGSIFAGESADSDHDTPWLMPAVAAGFSYPLIFTMSAGAMLPLSVKSNNDVFPTSPAIRADGELGLGGGTASAGVYIPIGGSFAVNLKAARMRTWLLTWNEESNRSFEGSIAEFVLLGHVPGKVGLGHFKSTETTSIKRDSFTYVFLGVGW